MSPGRRRLAIQLATIVAALAVYELVARSGIFYQGVLPPLAEIGRALVAELGQPEFYANLWVSAYEVFLGFAFGLVAGVLLGIVLGAAPVVSDVAAPFVDVFATTPKIIYLPIAMLLLGTGPASKVAMAAGSAIFPIVIAVAGGMRRIDPVLVRVGRSFRCTWAQMVAKIYLPSLVRPVVVGARLGFGLCIVIVLLSEIKIANKGIGYLTIDAYNHYRIPQMYALLLLIFAVAICANALITRLSTR